VTELIHHNRLVSMTATFGGLSPLAGLSRPLGSLNVWNDEPPRGLMWVRWS
jgi:hypothetical protein